MTQEQNPNIDPEILSQLGLTQEDVQTFDPEIQKGRRFYRRIEQFGWNEYERMTHHDNIDQGRVTQINLFDSVALESEGFEMDQLEDLHEIYQFRRALRRTSTEYPPKMHELPDELSPMVEQLLVSILYDKEKERMRNRTLQLSIPKEFFTREKVKNAVQRAKNVVQAFLIGFGDAALEAMDIRTAVNSYDAASPNGILNNDYAMARLNDPAIVDKTSRIQAARAIQSRIQQSTPS